MTMESNVEPLSTSVLLMMGVNPFPPPNELLGEFYDEKHPSGSGLSCKVLPRTSYGDHSLWAS